MTMPRNALFAAKRQNCHICFELKQYEAQASVNTLACAKEKSVNANKKRKIKNEQKKDKRHALKIYNKHRMESSITTCQYHSIAKIINDSVYITQCGDFACAKRLFERQSTPGVCQIQTPNRVLFSEN